MLKVTGDGRRAALDLRLVGEDARPKAGASSTSPPSGSPRSITPPATTATPTSTASSPSARARSSSCSATSPPPPRRLERLRRAARPCSSAGVSTRLDSLHAVAKTDVAKAKLFAACRDGTVAVLIGSTETMGVGTNVQARAIAMHHLDAPWRPADIEQRDGRILRQGNQNPEVRVLRYVTEGSFDTYMWQTLERKAAFIAQVTRGDLPDRDVDDIGDQALSFAEVKALATGDPLVLEKAAVDADVARLTRLERAHHDDQHRLRRTHDTATPAPRRPSTEPRTRGSARPGGRHPRRPLRHDHRRPPTPSGSTPANTSRRLWPTRLDQTPPETTGPT
jgi:hypothetical protein